VSRFEPKHMGDLRTRFDELWARAAHAPDYPANLGAEVLDLITQSKSALQLDAIGNGFVMQAVGSLNQGDLRLSLAKLKLAYESYLPS
jgi:hypothetical protein